MAIYSIYNDANRPEVKCHSNLNGSLLKDQGCIPRYEFMLAKAAEYKGSRVTRTLEAAAAQSGSRDEAFSKFLYQQNKCLTYCTICTGRREGSDE